MSKKLFQGMIQQIKEIIDSEVGIMDDEGFIVACSDENKIGQAYPFAHEILDSKDAVLTKDGSCFQKVVIKGKLEYVVFVSSDSKESIKQLFLISLNISNIKSSYD